eukprot:jgi/Mesvir1/1193/Mv17685-RA.1
MHCVVQLRPLCLISQQDARFMGCDFLLPYFVTPSKNTRIAHYTDKIPKMNLSADTTSSKRVRLAGVTSCAAQGMSPETVLETLGQSGTHIVSWFHGVPPLGVGVGVPCAVMDCGDIVYRSTLKQEAKQLTQEGLILLSLIGFYGFAPPGPALGFLDYYVLAPLENFVRKKYSPTDFKLGKKLGEGSFGTVTMGELLEPAKGESTTVVIKRAKEFGEEEIWMNKRVRRACPDIGAEFIDGFPEVGPLRVSQWLVWKYEGSSTLADLIMSRDFPYNMEVALLGEAVPADQRGPEREAAIIKAIMKQILLALKKLHGIGIVHRDMKPQNMVFAESTGQLKVIDLGAAADLRYGVNYIPNEFLLDPRYAAPEQYVMSTQTPKAPPTLVATLLSPVLWQLNRPDKFDMYSAGLIWLQLAIPALRSDNALISFNRQLKQCDYDLDKWRAKSKRAKEARDWMQGFELLDAENGAGWDLAKSLVAKRPEDRKSASAALLHPFFTGVGFLPVYGFIEDSIMKPTNESELGAWLSERFVKTGLPEVGGLSEYELNDMQKKGLIGTFSRAMRSTVTKFQLRASRTMLGRFFKLKRDD